MCREDFECLIVWIVMNVYNQHFIYFDKIDLERIILCQIEFS